MAAWNTRRIPHQQGRTAVVTGANSGLGLVTATELARQGAKVVLAVRDTAAGERARAAIRAAAPGAAAPGCGSWIWPRWSRSGLSRKD
ncbi:short-chain dehydrogenase/reductase SDR [Actinobacteria bacterium OK006]|jgi:NAD(P)-dependent dehydrogenase (short-subunit alcohol dehydrogenase family)|nr:short-chain dehydrogenase/reductase SDR [Actinobacteria bacterium OK006]